MSLLTKLFHFVLLTIQKYNIDESHGLSHSMNVLHYADSIYESELVVNPYLEKQKRIIYISAILHDMCDKKYTDENKGLCEIGDFLDNEITKEEKDIIKRIVNTMSYSKVKKHGFPDLKEYQHAYNIIREADLLTAYDFDRCMIYNMYKKGGNIETAFNDANELFEKRVFKHNDDGLFITDYYKKCSQLLHINAKTRIGVWKNIVKTPLI